MKISMLKLLFYPLACLFIFTACEPLEHQNQGQDAAQTDEKSTASTSDQKKYRVYRAPASQAYPKAQLRQKAPQPGAIEPGEVAFDFEVSQFELGGQTPGADERGIANSENGQHIHCIVDNGPYSAHYTPSFRKELDTGHHVVLSFLSRSYHESIKNEQAYALQLLTVGSPSDTLSFDLNGKHLFYSRPKGTYTGSDTEKLMLDFFLINTELSEDGNKVRATINGETHLITEWAPYFIEGLEMGEVEIELELIDAAGNRIPGPYNETRRTVSLKQTSSS